MNIVVLGAGAVGSLWAIKLRQAGHNVSVMTRLSAPSVLISSSDNHIERFYNNRPEEIINCDLLLVTVKAFQVNDALNNLIDDIHSDTIVVLLHNGMLDLNTLPERLSQLPLLLATTTHGALRSATTEPQSWKVQHTGLGITKIGPANLMGEKCQFLEAVLNHALPEVKWQSSIKDALMQKLIINCAINPITAIQQCSNGELIQYRDTVDAVVEEAWSVLTLDGLSWDLNTATGQVQDVITATSNNFSSMHQDRHFQRQSEIDSITGYLLERAQHHNIQLKENTRLYQTMKDIERGYTT